jgi:lipopolysaccharide/colanic/teichoic acid biosynthesis glycosyltransferase
MSDAFGDLGRAVKSSRARASGVWVDVDSAPARNGTDVLANSGLALKMLDGAPVAVDAKSLARNIQLKRILIDVPMAVGALIVLAPLMLTLAAAIKLTSSGPVFFRQKRVGLHGKEFDILKFRSMQKGQADYSGVRQTTANDDRVTKVGRFMRATSLDELPQLWNILRGDMAVVGPRPMVKGQLAAGVTYTQAVPYYDFRHQVRPGLTGWAQANGYRGPTTDAVTARQRIDHDCAYVQNVSLSLDIKIIQQTARREFLTGTGI